MLISEEYIMQHDIIPIKYQAIKFFIYILNSDHIASFY